MINNTTYRVLVEKLGASQPNEFIGNEGEIFYDPNTPELKLSDGSTIGGLTIAGGGGGETSSQWVTTSAGIHTLSNVGIGTTNPQANLQVQGDLIISAGVDSSKYITIKAYEDNGGTLSFEGSEGQLFSVTNNLTSGSIFNVNDISGNPIIDANANGNLGIGTTNPQYKLDVGGDLNFTGTLYQNGVAFSGGGSGAFSYCCTTNITSNLHPDITTACYNFFAGVSAGCSITSGSYNNFFGLSAGRFNTIGGYNNFFGLFAGCENTTGCANNFFGYNAGRCNTIGCSNNFFGPDAGRYNTTGSDNNFFGRLAGHYNTTGYYNNFLGPGAGVFNTTGHYNNFFGQGAGRYNTTGTGNNFLGSAAGRYNTTGNNNNFFGTGAGAFNTIGYGNNFFGTISGQFNTTGYGNNFLGYYAGRYNTTGYLNNFLGHYAGYFNTNGTSNNVLGNYSGISTSTSYKVTIGSGYNYTYLFDSPDTTKDMQFAVGVRTDGNPSKYWLVGNENFNVGIGTTNPQYKLDVGGDLNFTGTLYQNGVAFSGGGSGAFSFCCTTNITSTLHPDITSANNNFFAGVGAGCSITSGCHNNFIGAYAGGNNTTGNYNNFFGIKSGTFNTGDCNNFIGYYAGWCNTGYENTIIGLFAGAYNIGYRNNLLGNNAGRCNQGDGNNFIGVDAGVHNLSGGYNNFFGKAAGYNNDYGCYNNFLGYSSGYCNTEGGCNNFFGYRVGNSNSTGINNIFVGSYSGYYNTTGSYNNFFGYYSGAKNVSGSNNTFLGNNSGSSTSNSFKIVIGSSYDYNHLFDSPITTKDAQLAIGIRTNTNPSKYWIVGNENFNVGIGTTNPTNKLTVGGDIRAGLNNSQGVILTSSNGTQYRLVVDDSGALSTVAV